jgi:hypothetical protein
MAEPRQSPTIVPTTGVLRSARGPRIANYVIPLDRPRLYRWSAGDDQDHNGVTAIVPAGTGGMPGAWVDVPEADKGEDLTDGDATIRPSGGSYRRLPPTPLTANRSITLGVSTATDIVRAGHWIWLSLDDAAAFSCSVLNGGPAAGTLGIKPSGARAWLLAYFDGTNWECRGSGLMLSTS